MTEKQYTMYDVGSSYLTSCGVEAPDGDCFENMTECCKELNRLLKENEQLKEALKKSYINEICENCKHGNYFKTDNFIGGFEWDFECTKKHFGNDHWKCDGLTECDDFELEIKGDVE